MVPRRFTRNMAGPVVGVSRGTALVAAKKIASVYSDEAVPENMKNPPHLPKKYQRRLSYPDRRASVLHTGTTSIHPGTPLRRR